MIPLYKFREGTADIKWETKYAREERSSADERVPQQRFVQTLLRHLPPGARVLDAGCGTGDLLSFLHARGFRVSGVDTSSTAVAVAKRKTPGAEIVIANIEQLPFPNASFDAYVAIGSWEYPERGPEQAAREAARVVRTGGLACIEVPRANPLRRLTYLPLKRLEFFFRRARGERPRLAHHFFHAAEIERLLGKHGFEILSRHAHDLPERTRHYGLWIDWPFLRGGPRYELNRLGRLAKTAGNALSPWTIATGMFIVARKQ